MRNFVYIALVTLAYSVWNYIGWQRSPAEMWASSIGMGMVFAVVAVRYARTNEVFAEWLLPVWGDASRGLVLAVASAAAFYGIVRLLSPMFVPVWTLRYCSSYGNPMMLRAFVNSLLPLMALRVALEEIVWRGHVRSLLSEELGSRIAWRVALVLFVATSLPSLWALSTVGLNPLRAIVVLIGGVAAAIYVRFTDRLLPGILGRTALEWVVLAFHSLWGVG